MGVGRILGDSGRVSEAQGLRLQHGFPSGALDSRGNHGGLGALVGSSLSRPGSDCRRACTDERQIEEGTRHHSAVVESVTTSHSWKPM